MTEATGPVVEACGVSKWFGETTALDAVDFTVAPGVVHGVLGPNGAGKTTLLSALFGLVLLDEGTLKLFGRTRAEAGPAWLDRVAGFVETPRFYPYLSGRRNLAVLAGLDGGDAAGIIDEALERADLAEARGKKVKGYSLGMRQRLGLAAAMLRRPRLLILDEPTNGMDPAGIRDLRAALRRLARDGVTVILSSHNMTQVEEICDAVTMLHRGKVAFAGRLDAMRADAPDPVWRLRTSDDDAGLRQWLPHHHGAALYAAHQPAVADRRLFRYDLSKGNQMRRLLSPRWRHAHRRAVRTLTAVSVAVVMVAGFATAAVAGTFGGGFGNSQAGTANADGILLPANQRIKPIGTRLLISNGRLLSSSISPNGQYPAALSWEDFTGFLTVFNLKTGTVVQQIGTGVGTDKTIGDGTVAADGPLWSADGKTLWFPQTADLVKFSVAADGTVSSPVTIPLETATTNLNTTTSTTPDLPSGMALSPDGSKLYVALNGVNELGVIDTATNQLTPVIKVGNAPRQVVLVGSDAFVSDEGGRPAKAGDFTNESDGTAIVAGKVTGAATTGTVSEVDLGTGEEVREIPVGLEPTAEYLAPDGTLMVANSNDDTFSLINPQSASVVQTVNVNPLPGSTVGSYPNAITMPDSHHILVSIGRDNALAVYYYSGARSPVQYQGLLPTDFYPVAVADDPALGKIVVTSDKGIGARGTASTINKGPGTAPGAESVTGHNTYDDTGSVTDFTMPSTAALGAYTDQVFTGNDWAHLLATQSLTSCTAAPAAVPAKLGCPSPIKHVFLIIRENRTYDQVLGDIGKGSSDPALAQFGKTITPNAHALAGDFGLFDNFYDEGTLSADGHNWIVQADANDYIEKEFGAFHRSYPAQGGDALAYQRDGFIWNAAEAAGRTTEAYGEYNNFLQQQSPGPSWPAYYQDSQILEGKATGTLPVPVSSVSTYADIPSLNAIDDHEYPSFDLGIPDQYRTSGTSPSRSTRRPATWPTST